MSYHAEMELEQLDRLAQFDRLIDRLKTWTVRESSWEPVGECQALLTRVLQRTESLRIRLESPLVVGMFGGTGTGKSSLVNALVGQECATTGRERPTTRKPTLIVHPKNGFRNDPFALDDIDVVRVESSLLRDILILDCPDPDTSEGGKADANEMSNLERLQALVPHCDVLIYTSTQQKYRSSRVKDELGQAATGCRLVFVQTHADVDSDIRDDWQKHLSKDYEISETFFVNSLLALKEQQEGRKVTGELGRLQDFLIEQLASSRRMEIRRANVVDLLESAVKRCKETVDHQFPAVEELEEELAKQNMFVQQKMSGKLTEELQISHQAWERRLISTITERWGTSPFSIVMRIYQGLGGFLASIGLMRARTTAHVAVIGTIQGMRWWGQRQEDSKADSQLKNVGGLGLDETALSESRLVIAGYARSAKMKSEELESRSLERLKNSAALVEEEFLVEAGGCVDQIINELAKKNSGPLVRFFYELFFIGYLGFILYRVGKNFFFDSFLHGEEILDLNFYIPAGLFFLLWTSLLLMMMTRRLRIGLRGRIATLAAELVQSELTKGLFPELELACQTARIERGQLEQLKINIDDFQKKIRNDSRLGSPNRES